MNRSSLFQRVKTWLSDLTVGGVWGRTLTAVQQRNLTWYWFDGFFASASDSIILTYVSLYIITLGASAAQVGLMSSISSLVSAALLLPGAFLAERAARKKRIPLGFAAGGRFSIFLLVFVPIFFKSPAAVWVAIAFSVTRDACNFIGWPAWMDLTNGVVPIDGRGRYFGSRNFIMGITGIAATLLAGKLITLFTSVTGYQIALASAFVLGMASTYSFAHIDEDAAQVPAQKRSSFSLRGLGRVIRNQPNFIALTITAAMWNFAVNISGPFFNVQMVNVLHFSAATIGLVSVITTFFSLLTQKSIGAFADRNGNRRLQLISMWLMPLLPAAWIFVTEAWHVALINVFSGIFWGTYNLVSFNLLLASVPHDQVPRFSALYQVVVLISIALGAAAGSAIIAAWGFTAVLIASTSVRIITAAVFTRFVREPSLVKSDQ